MSNAPPEADIQTTVNGIDISPDGSYIYAFVEAPDGPTDHGFCYKWDLSTGAEEWVSTYDATQANPGYDMAVAESGDAYTISTNGLSVIIYASADGSTTSISLPKEHAGVLNGFVYEIEIDETQEKVIVAGAQGSGKQYDPADIYNMVIMDMDGSNQIKVQVGGYFETALFYETPVIRNGHVVAKSDYIYILAAEPTPKLYKYEWDGTEDSNTAAPADSIGLYEDLYGNLVVVTQQWIGGLSEVYHYYDKNFNSLATIDGFSTTLLRPWVPSVSNAIIQGNVHFFPGINRSNEQGNANTAVGSQAMRGADNGAEPNEATAVGFKSMYSVLSGDLATGYGAFSLYSLTTGSQDVTLGPYSGYWLTTEDDKFVVDSPAAYKRIRRNSILDSLRPHGRRRQRSMAEYQRRCKYDEPDAERFDGRFCYIRRAGRIVVRRSGELYL